MRETMEDSFPLMEHAGEGVRVGNSPVGLGVFAVRQFRPDEFVGPVYGRVIDDPNYGSDYAVELADRLSMEPDAPFRFLNHSCQPNCTLVVFEDDRGGEDPAPGGPDVWVEALGKIKPGDQLTIDYAWPAEAAIPCCCGNPNCRGWVVAEDQVHRLRPPFDEKQWQDADLAGTSDQSVIYLK